MSLEPKKIQLAHKADGYERIIAPYIKEISELLIEWDNDYQDVISGLNKNSYKVNVEYTPKIDLSSVFYLLLL